MAIWLNDFTKQAPPRQQREPLRCFWLWFHSRFHGEEFNADQAGQEILSAGVELVDDSHVKRIAIADFDEVTSPIISLC